MPALNRVQLIGNLGRDPETRFTPTGQKVCNFSVAVSRRWTSKEGRIQRGHRLVQHRGLGASG